MVYLPQQILGHTNRFNRALSAAMDTLRKSRESCVKREEGKIFNRKIRKEAPATATKKKRMSSWTRKFCCLAFKDQFMIPTTEREKDQLDKTGLGKKKITISSMDCTAKELHNIIIETFPPLKDIGGFEFLRCKANSRMLEPFSDMAQSTPSVLAERSATCTIYIRPIQQDIDIRGSGSQVGSIASHDTVEWFILRLSSPTAVHVHT